MWLSHPCTLTNTTQTEKVHTKTFGAGEAQQSHTLGVRTTRRCPDFNRLLPLKRAQANPWPGEPRHTVSNTVEGSTAANTVALPAFRVHGGRLRRAATNDPSAGSPTETLLRLLLPLNDQIRTTSRDPPRPLPTAPAPIRRSH